MGSSTLAALSVFASIFAPVLGSLYTDPAQFPDRQYDYVVVGGGAGGGVVASRLTEDPSINVLLIEAGISHEGVEDVAIPFLCPGLSPNTPLDWNYTTVPQKGLNNRVINYPRGRLLGGSTSTNFMVYTHGSSEDYDRYANVSGDAGWSWNALQPFIKGMEQLVPPADNHNTSGQIDPSIHGHSGPLGVTVQGFPSGLDSMVINTTQQLSAEFPFNLDMNSGNPIGVGWAQYTIRNGSRDSSATAYIQPALTRPNFDVLINTQVTKLIQTGSEKGVPVFRGVQFAQSSSGPFFTVNASREAIVSAGTVSTPQILMLSGIGDESQLKQLGIKALVNLPDVGQNLQDHVLLPNVWSVNATSTYDDIGRNATLADDMLSEWESSRQGQYATGPSNHVGWLRLPDNATIFETVQDPTAGPHSAHFEFIFGDGFNSYVLDTPTEGRYLTLSSNVVSPTSRGSITLNSSDPFVFPNIDPALLNSDFDVFTIREAIRAAQRFVSAPVWKDYIIAPFGGLANATTDEEIESYARQNADTVWHPVGTASMSAWNAKNGVVNPDLTVKNTVGLRVVDASVLPFIPGAHTGAAVFAFAERAASLIKASRS